MRDVLLTGIARVAPDVLTFATPVFSDLNGGYLTQISDGDAISGFDGVSIGEELQPLSTVMWASVGNACVHCFEIAKGEFLVGDSVRLAKFLKTNEGRWAERRDTAASVRRFLATSEAQNPSAPLPTTRLIRAFAKAKGASEVPIAPPSESGRAPVAHDLQGRQGGSADLALLDLVQQASTEHELRSLFSTFAGRIGVDKIAAALILERGGFGEFRCMQDGPTGFVESHLSRWIEGRDPVLRRAQHSAAPIFWSRDTYLAADALDLWEEQAKNGLHAGIVCSVYLPGGRRLLFGADREAPFPTDPVLLNRMISTVQLLAVYAQESLTRLLQPTSGKHAIPSLTVDEHATLRWAMNGKTIRETSEVMQVGEKTVSAWLRSAMLKLGSVKKHQAVLRAMELGLL